MTASFERFNYELRYNKHIERQLIFEMLARASGQFHLSSYRYLGFGSIWFADFRLAHRTLGITKMMSMEYDEYAPRAEFNVPYRSIQVQPGDCSLTLNLLPNEEWEIPVICWLDYDGGLKQQVCDDIKLLCEKCAPNSVILVTVNGERGTYRPRIDKVERQRGETALGQIEHLLGTGSIPAEMEPGKTGAGFQRDIPEAQFPQFLAKALLTFIEGSVFATGRRTVEASPRPLSFTPIFNFSHQDGAAMVTVGGVIADPAGTEKWQRVAMEVWGVAAYGRPDHQAIDLVPLTVREKLRLDELLPHDKQQFLQAASDIPLEPSQLEKYWRYYRHFPAFAEVPL